MFGIGSFAALTQTTARTLRHYDEVGLLAPARIDPATSYRFYSATQIPRLNRIIALRDLGFGIDEIRALLDEGVSAEQMRGMLLLRRSETQARLDKETERLRRIEARLLLIESEDSMADFDIVIKSIPAQRCAIASGPAKGFGPPNLRSLLEQLYRRVGAGIRDQGVAATGAVFAYYE